MEFVKTLLLVVAPILTTGIVGFATWALKEVRKSRDIASQRHNEDMEILKRAMVNMTRRDMIVAHRNAVTDQEITMFEKNNFLEMHASYIELGGNSVASHFIDDVRQVKLVS